ncbi:MAG: 50S ribosomal protein L23 [Candidatus Paceibacterota bacterium]|jgi:large subunit ribosomal protein L23
MGILNFKKEEGAEKPKKVAKTKALAVKAKPEVAVKAKSASAVKAPVATDVIIRPRITEKASFLGANNVYAFEITTTATKPAVERAITEMYKVNPVKVRIVRNPAKQKIARGVKGEIAGVKKAYVFLKKGDKIEII